MSADLLRRDEALKKTLAKFKGAPFDWGKADCISMARSHLVAMGHKRVPKLPKYRDAAGAASALKETGFDTLEALLDSLLPRIAPASMLPGDLVLLEGEPPFDCVTICLGRKVLGFHQDAEGAEVLKVNQFKAAWRV